MFRLQLPLSMVRCPMVILLTFCACGDPIENEIQNLVEGGEKAERAKMALNLAKAAAMDPLIEALQDQNHPVRARADLVEAVYRLYLREEDERLLQARVGALEDPAAQVRSVTARAIGDLKKDKLANPSSPCSSA